MPLDLDLWSKETVEIVNIITSWLQYLVSRLCLGKVEGGVVSMLAFGTEYVDPGREMLLPHF